jgi:hypothetical protein
MNLFGKISKLRQDIREGQLKREKRKLNDLEATASIAKQQNEIYERKAKANKIIEEANKHTTLGRIKQHLTNVKNKKAGRQVVRSFDNTTPSNNSIFSGNTNNPFTTGFRNPFQTVQPKEPKQKRKKIVIYTD